VIHDEALVPQGRAQPPIAVRLALVGDAKHRLHERGVVHHARRGVRVGRAREAHQPTSLRDGEADGPLTTEGGPFLGRGACLSAPLRNSSSSVCWPTNRSSAAIRAS